MMVRRGDKKINDDDKVVQRGKAEEIEAKKMKKMAKENKKKITKENVTQNDKRK